MIKITLMGQVYSFDNDRYPLTEAIELETALEMPFGEWQAALFRGSAKAAAGLAWLVLKRAGEEVPLADILSGKFEMVTTDIRAEPEGDPDTDPTALSAASAGASGNGTAPSPKPSGSPPPTSAPSVPTSSTT